LFGGGGGPGMLGPGGAPAPGGDKFGGGGMAAPGGMGGGGGFNMGGPGMGAAANMGGFGALDPNDPWTRLMMLMQGLQGTGAMFQPTGWPGMAGGSPTMAIAQMAAQPPAQAWGQGWGQPQQRWQPPGNPSQLYSPFVRMG